jgi:hypothetical protein
MQYSSCSEICSVRGVTERQIALGTIFQTKNIILHDGLHIPIIIIIITIIFIIIIIIVFDLVFENISDMRNSISSSLVVTPDKHHPPLSLGFSLILECHRIPLTPHLSYVQGDYLLLYNILPHFDPSYVLNENAVYSVVNGLTATVRERINLAIPYIK